MKIQKKIIFYIILVTFSLIGCSQSKLVSRNVTPDLPPIHANERVGVYFLPDCEQYNKLNHRVLLVLPTIQEAELSGYRPAPCAKKNRESRIAEEIKIYGTITPTTETTARKSQLATQRKLNEIEMRQDEMEDKQREIEELQEEKQRELEDKQRELEDKQEELDSRRKY